MLRMTRSLSILILAGVIAPVANASAFGRILHIHPAVSNSKDVRVNFTLLNKSDVPRSVTVDGHTYTLSPHQSVQVSAVAGSRVTEADAASTKPAAVLFVVDRTHKGATITIN